MPIAIALAWSEQCEIELRNKGFTKREVYVREDGRLSSEKHLIESELFRMTSPPFQFLVADFWGAGPD